MIYFYLFTATKWARRKRAEPFDSQLVTQYYNLSSSCINIKTTCLEKHSQFMIQPVFTTIQLDINNKHSLPEPRDENSFSTLQFDSLFIEAWWTTTNPKPVCEWTQRTREVFFSLIYYTTWSFLSLLFYLLPLKTLISDLGFAMLS